MGLTNGLWFAGPPSASGGAAVRLFRELRSLPEAGVCFPKNFLRRRPSRLRRRCVTVGAGRHRRGPRRRRLRVATLAGRERGAVTAPRSQRNYGTVAS